MKKIFASLTALACAATIFTGCGKTDDDKKDSGKKGSSSSSSDELEDLLNDMIGAAKDKDIKKLIKYSLPDELADSAFDIAADQLNDLADELGDEYTEEDADAELISVKKTEDMDENYVLILEKAFSFALTFAEYMEKNDLTFEDMENMDVEELMETPLGSIASLMQTIDSDIDSPEDLINTGILDKIDSKITITEACMAEVTVKSDGETDSMELPFYYIKGEGWNSDMIFYPAMIGYVKKSKAASANTTAKTLYNAANSALVDMEEENLDIRGNFIIHSDDSKNYNVSKDFDVDKFKEYLNDYAYSADEIDYFIVVSDYAAPYVACVYNGTTGIYPIETGVTFDDYGEISSAPLTSDADRSLDGLYERAVKAIDEAK